MVPPATPTCRVLFGALPAVVVSWSDARPSSFGCRPARDPAASASARRRSRARAGPPTTADERELGEALASVGCLAIGDTWAPAPYVPAAPPCHHDGANRFGGSVPVVEVFTVNGGTDVTVEPGTHLLLAWRVTNVSSVRIRRTGDVGPALDPDRGHRRHARRGGLPRKPTRGRGLHAADGQISAGRSRQKSRSTCARFPPFASCGVRARPGDPALRPECPGAEQQRAAGTHGR